MKYFKIIFGLICLTVAFSTASAEYKTTNLSSIEDGEFVIRKCIVRSTENSCLAIPGLTTAIAKKIKPEHLSETMKTHRPVEIARVSKGNSFFPPDNKTITRWTVSFDNEVFTVRDSVQTETDWWNIIGDIIIALIAILVSATGKISFSLNERHMSKMVIYMTVTIFTISYYINGLIVGFPNWFMATLPGVLFVASTIWATYDKFTSKLYLIFAGGLLSWYVSTISGIGEFVNIIGGPPKIMDFQVLHCLSVMIILITLDYTVVLYRKYQKSKSKATLLQ